ncbi:tumor necrosis factor receptor superfamily member 18 [Enoplosus armatus]|uniref:tumor necrosis factor receptor superfamily member 18 n=1 Tax=Enoplosus armatus TaxID=215367 RepID=UPI0039964239
MIPLSISLAAMCALSIWTMGYAADCGAGQTVINGRCCDMCPPGTFMSEFCSEHQQTVCSPCEEGSFSKEYNMFDRCEKCRPCQQEYAQKCTPTANANCSCGSGFLCSNNVCSNCKENKCITGEKLKTTTSLGNGLIEYSYHCEPSCPDNAYFDAKEDVCKPRTQCSIFGLAEQFPGNKTHNAVCDGREMHRNGGDFTHVFLGIGFVLLSFSLLVFLSCACIKNLRKRKPHNTLNHIIAGSTNTSDFHLSKEESGRELIIQDESTNSESFGLLHLEKVTAFR